MPGLLAACTVLLLALTFIPAPCTAQGDHNLGPLDHAEVEAWRERMHSLGQIMVNNQRVSSLLGMHCRLPARQATGFSAWRPHENHLSSPTSPLPLPRSHPQPRLQDAPCSGVCPSITGHPCTCHPSKSPPTTPVSPIFSTLSTFPPSLHVSPFRSSRRALSMSGQITGCEEWSATSSWGRT
jgi:hypothetical protein